MAWSDHVGPVEEVADVPGLQRVKVEPWQTELLFGEGGPLKRYDPYYYLAAPGGRYIYRWAVKPEAGRGALQTVEFVPGASRMRGAGTSTRGVGNPWAERRGPVEGQQLRLMDSGAGYVTGNDGGRIDEAMKGWML